MTFWIFSALLILVALAFLLPPLLRKSTDIMDDRRDQNINITKHQLEELETEFNEGGLEEETYLQAKAELEDTLYSDLKNEEDVTQSVKSEMSPKLPVIIVALLIPAVSFGMYLKVGNPTGIAESSVDRSQSATANNPNMSIEKMLVTLEEKLKTDPKNYEGWVMLGRSYMVTERPEDAAKAYEKALTLKPDDSSTMLQMADALATSKQGDLQGKPEELILKALKIDSENVMGLWLAGMASRQRGEKTEAISYWNKVLPKLSPDEKKEVQKMITEAGGKVTDAAPTAAVAPVPLSNTAKQIAPQATKTPEGGSAAAVGITVKIDIAEELKSKASPEQILFIYAKPVSGSPMPLAAVRKQVIELPIEIILNDSMAMTPQGKISNYKEVKVGARISMSGTPTKSSGDLFTEQSPVKLGSSISLTIDQVAK